MVSSNTALIIGSKVMCPIEHSMVLVTVFHFDCLPKSHNEIFGRFQLSPPLCIDKTVAKNTKPF